MLEIIIKQAERKIQESKKRVDIYYSINQGGHLDMMIRVEESNIKQMEDMIQDLRAGMAAIAI